MSKPLQKHKRPVDAQVIGVSIGTSLTLFANSLPVSNPYKTWLLIFCPTITAVIAWVTVELKMFAKKRQSKILKAKFKLEIEERLKKPGISVKEKLELKGMLTEFEKSTLENMSDKIKRLDIEINGQ